MGSGGRAGRRDEGFSGGNFVRFDCVIEFPERQPIFHSSARAAGGDGSEEECCMAESKTPPATAEELRVEILLRYESLRKRLQQIARYVLDERSEEQTSERQSLMRSTYAAYSLKKKKKK